jgi:hypothetical protein
MNINLVLSILFVHFVADFLLQDDMMAINKSKSNYCLSVHCIVYFCAFFIAFGFIYSLFIASGTFLKVLFWLILNAVLHFCVDYVTSRINSNSYKNNNRYLFFGGIGLDQFIHVACMLKTWVWILE